MQLLEDDAVRGMLARGHADRRNRLRNTRMPQYIVRMRRLLGPPQLATRQLLDARDRFVHIPTLIAVDHQLVFRSDRLAHG